MTDTVLEEVTALVREIGAITAQEREPRELLNGMLGAVERRLGLLRATVTLRQGEGLVIEASPDLREAERSRGRYHLGEGITGLVAASGRPEIVEDIRRDGRFLNRTGGHSFADDGTQVAFICVPVVHAGEVIGTLSADRVVGPGTELARDAAMLQIAGSLAAGVLAARQAEQGERDELLAENRTLRDILAGTPGDMVGNCPEMQLVLRQIRQVAPTSATVLVRGSTGTGKERVARAIVQLSDRRDKPFVTLNCAALPEALVESELFGHEKGAFTGAVARRIGRAEEADGGTLFLDEIGDLTPQTQVKLLRFLQERTFSRVGSNAVIRSDVRFLAATSRDLEDLMARGLFREDLYYRLNVFPIRMPDLRDRKSDIILLAEHFLERMNVKYGKHVRRISTPAINMMTAYHWPGNVRELENCIEHAVLTATDEAVHAYNLPPSLQTGKTSGTALLPDEKASYDQLVASYGRELLVEALKRHDGNMSAAGRDLGLSPRVMHYKIHHLGIVPRRYARAD